MSLFSCFPFLLVYFRKFYLNTLPKKKEKVEDAKKKVIKAKKKGNATSPSTFLVVFIESCVLL